MAYNRHKIVRWLEANGFAPERRTGGHLVLVRGEHRVSVQAHGRTDMAPNVLASLVRTVSVALHLPRRYLKRAWR